jgi:hypothetical protein
VDPPNIYNQIDMRITVWTTGVTGNAPTVGIRPTGTMDALTMLGNPIYNGTNRIFATLSTALVGPGDYDVVVIDDPCDSELINGLHVTATLGVHVSNVDPGFGLEGTTTGVTIESDIATAGGLDNFKKTPRVFFNPVAGGTATELRAVQWLDDPEKIVGVVPDTLTDGDYQVLVINPDGKVGLLSPKVFTVLDTLDPPPIITDLDPGLVRNTTSQDITILGESFPTVGSDLTVTATCRDPRDPNPASTETPLTPVTVTPVSATQIDTTWDIANGLDGFVCIVRVANDANGSFVNFSAFSVTGSAGNLKPFFDSNRLMNEARRALAAATLRLNAQSRFLFAIGGDAGDDSINPVIRSSSVEAAPLDPFGAIIADFEIQRNALPETRAFTAATTIGRYVYLAGGRVGAMAGTVDDKVLRAYLLDPSEAPIIDDLNLEQGDGTGLDAGVWYYRVAAVMNDGVAAGMPDPNNPGGEGLASDPLVVQLPALTNKVLLTLRWDHIPGAIKYRVYRTTAPNGISGEEVLLAEMNTINGGGGSPLPRQSFLDNGVDNTAETDTPMPVGSLGTWHQVGTLTTAREGAAIVAVPDPREPQTHYLYVIGGRTSAGAALDSYERIEITAAGPSSQTLAAGGMVPGTAVLPTSGGRGPRWQMGAVYFDSRKSTAITNSDDVFVYALPGITGSGQSVTRVTSLKVDIADGTDDGEGVDGDGSLSAAVDTVSPGPTYAGYGYVGNHNFIHLMGAQTGGPSQSGMETFITGSPPTLDPWDAGTDLVFARYLHASAAESAFVFLLGGQNSATIFATKTVEQTNF